MTRRLIGTTLVATTLVLALSACGVTGGASTTATDSGPYKGLQVMVPNAPGSGYDVTGRAAVRVMDEIGVSSGTEVTNLAGAGGTVGLARTLTEKGNANFLLVMGKDPDALPPALDLEYAGNCSSRPSPAVLRREVAAFTSAVQKGTGRAVVLYVLDDTEHSYKVRNGTNLPLWPRRFPWRPSSPRWVIWQLHGFARVDGVRGQVDLDVANLSILDASSPAKLR